MSYVWQGQKSGIPLMNLDQKSDKKYLDEHQYSK